jgi:hypothetical protein
MVSEIRDEALRAGSVLLRTCWDRVKSGCAAASAQPDPASDEAVLPAQVGDPYASVVPRAWAQGPFAA